MAPFLCDICTHLDLSLETFSAVRVADASEALDSKQVLSKARLGNLYDVSTRKNCSLCQCVLECIETNGTHDTTEDYEISLVQLPPLRDRKTEDDFCPVMLFLSTPGYTGPNMYIAPDAPDSLIFGATFQPYFGRRLKTRTEQCCLIRRWLKTCEAQHSNDCVARIRHDGELEELRLIDVHKQCIVLGSSNSRYLALSYVWGDIHAFQLATSNLQSLMQPKSLAGASKFVPKTIKDAMELTDRIGERFIWVDRLCIVQDDETEKARLIPQMDRIFNDALLVIIAMTSQTADAGIFEVSREQQVCYHTKCDLEFVPIRGYDSISDHLDWYLECRAWTYQEQQLARRQIMFINGLAFFKCCSATWREDLILEECDNVYGYTEHNYMVSISSDTVLSENRYGLDLSRYIYHVELYTMRTLTFPDDVLNAFNGITSIYARQLNTDFYYGLPVIYFNITLLWCPFEEIKRREGFPSWSWTGWIGSIDMSELRAISKENLIEQSWVHFYSYCSQDNTFTPLRNSSKLRHDVAEESRMSKLYKELLTYDIHEHHYAPISSSEVANMTLSELPSLLGHPSMKGHLRFFTIVAYFDVSCSGARYDLLGRFGNILAVPFPGASYYEDLKPLIHGRRELIVLSENRMPGTAAQKVFAMITQRKGEVLERLAIVTIEKEDLLYSWGPGPEWKEITLG